MRTLTTTPDEPGAYVPLWLAAGLALAALLIGASIGILWEGRNLEDATTSANEAERVAGAARDAAEDARVAAEQSAENGRKVCVLADGIRALIVVGVTATTPEVEQAITNLERLEGQCEAEADENAATSTTAPP